MSNPRPDIRYNPMVFSVYNVSHYEAVGGPIPPGEYGRITEDSQIRITEDGNTRVTE